MQYFIDRPFLITLLSEEMIKIKEPKVYMLGYSLFIFDWPDEDGLIKVLVDVTYRYEKIRKN